MIHFTKKTAILLTFALSTGSLAHGECYSFNQWTAENNPHNIHFGINLFGLQLNTPIQDATIQGTNFFWGLTLGYEYLKPQAFYAGVDLSAATSRIDHWHDYYLFILPSASKILSNLDLRFGYTFTPCKWFTTPFLGVGIYDLSNMDQYNNQGFMEDLPYISGGVRTKYTFNPLFNLGLNFKIFRTFCAEQKIQFWGLPDDRIGTHRNTWGTEIGVPFIWNIGCAKRWDIQFEPYFSSLDLAETQNIYGIRLLAGYCF